MATTDRYRKLVFKIFAAEQADDWARWQVLVGELRRCLKPGQGSRFNHAKSHCKRGHKLDGDNLLVRSSDGARVCRACRRIRERAANVKRI